MGKKSNGNRSADKKRAAKAARRQHRRDVRERYSKRELPSGLKAVPLPRPREDVPHEEVVRHMAAYGRDLSEKLPGLVERLIGLLRTTQRADLLVGLVLRNLLQASQNQTHLHDKPYLSHLEYLQALALTLTPNPDEEAVPHPSSDNVVDEVEALVSEAHHAFSLMRLHEVIDESGAIRLDPAKPVIEYMRLHTQAVRVPGYPFQIDEALEGVLGAMDAALRRSLNVSAQDVCQTLRSLRRLVENRVNGHMEGMHEVLQKRTMPAVVTAYYKVFPDLQGSQEDLVALFQQAPDPLEVARHMVMAHSTFRVFRSLTITGADVCADTKGTVSPDAAERVLDLWSYSWGELHDHAVEHFFLDNPVWRKPYIRTEPGSYLVLNPVAHHAFPWLMIEALVAKAPVLAKPYAKARSDFLEARMSTIIEQRLPSGVHLRNAKWRHPASGDEYETDHVCIIGPVLLISEAKSGKVQRATLRGAAGSLKDNIYSMMEYPSRQSKRLSDALEDAAAGIEIVAQDGRKHVLRKAEVRRIVRINTTLDLIGLLTTRWGDLKDAGLIDDEAPMAPTIPLFDLDAVARVLQSEGAFLHYLYRRDYIERSLNYSGDELDLLGFYLKTGFNISDPKALSTRSSLALLARQFDEFFLRNDPPPPNLRVGQPRFSRFWKKLVSKVESNSNAEVQVIGSMILRDVAPELQIEIEKGVERARANVRRFRRPKDNVIQIATGHGDDKSVLLFCAYDNSPDLVGRDVAINAANAAAEEHGADRVLAFWHHADHSLHVYDGMALLFY